ncbi:disulfide bond formation protein B [Bartonella sp. A05]|uniref:disulfide bond formation protein B n=1 Tax=Bartonella sp. A05 TaxID=2967261 RepID=UPI0022A8F70A|nr:disulfide bond formation protein B [Bartonella sp. A05]MCZ2203682.1 disulfide bond formation protein B [Bartonella sp. A05]
MTFCWPFQHMLQKHLHLKLSKKEQSLWALFLAFCLSATIGLALGFEYIEGYIPCDLCLIERVPYYSAIPLLILAGLLAWCSHMSSWVRFLFLCVFILMINSLLFAVYHAGVEYGFWPAPLSCGQGTTKLTADVNQLLAQLNNIHPPSCVEAPGRFLFLSFAGWNAVASLFYTFISLYAASKGLLANRHTS